MFEILQSIWQIFTNIGGDLATLFKVIRAGWRLLVTLSMSARAMVGLFPSWVYILIGLCTLTGTLCYVTLRR